MIPFQVGNISNAISNVCRNKFLLLYFSEIPQTDVIEVDDDEDDTSEELVKPKRCKCGESAQSQNQGRGCRQPTQ